MAQEVAPRPRILTETHRMVWCPQCKKVTRHTVTEQHTRNTRDNQTGHTLVEIFEHCGGCHTDNAYSWQRKSL